MLDPLQTGMAGSIFASLATVLENEVDELKAAYEERASIVEATQTVASDGGIGGLTVILIVLGLAAIMLGAVFFAKYRRQASDEADDMESPLFEDQYAIQDEDIVIETEAPATEFEEITIETVPEPEPEPVMALSEAEEELPAEAGEEWPHHDEPPLHADGQPEAESAPEPEEPAENVIPLLKRAEPAPEEADTAPPDDETAIAADDEEIAANEDAVRYAFAARQQGPMSFSGISSSVDDEPARTSYYPQPEEHDVHDEPEEEDLDFRRRSWIAPTILREDLHRLERHQSDRIDVLRDEVTRQISSLKADQNNRFDIVVDALDRKLTKLTELRFDTPVSTPADTGSDHNVGPLLGEFSRQVNMLQSAMENQSQRIRAITQILDDRLGTVSHVYGEVRSIGEKIDRFNERIDEMEKSIHDNSRLDMMADVQLSDVIRSSLPPDSYEFKPLLSNNHRADCIIRLPHPPGTIVVDTRFPLDAFNALPSREEAARGAHDARGAEDSFRRAVLRHIIDVAERYIIPGETADSALMFVPTESIYTTLHNRFPDLIRDSFRARVWIVSPSTLMATLQTLRGMLRDSQASAEASRRNEQDEAMRGEMEELHNRASTLARNLQNTQSELNAILEATDRVFARPKGGKGPASGNGNGRRDHLVNELYDRQSEWPGKSHEQSPTSRHYEPEHDKRPSSLYEEFSRRPDPLR